MQKIKTFNNAKLRVNYTNKVVKQTNRKLEAEVEERTIAEATLRVAQDELIQAGKLAALGQLSVGITHEINQPLTAVNSHVRSAQLWLGKQRPDRAEDNLKKIEVLLEKVAAITRHLKAFSRKSDGKIDNVELENVRNESFFIAAFFCIHIFPSIPSIFGKLSKYFSLYPTFIFLRCSSTCNKLSTFATSKESLDMEINTFEVNSSKDDL